MSVITRFAPSPTGFLHVGSVRTALFSWLYAKHNKGKFILRIEDTDQIRSTQAFVKVILEALAWLGLDTDEGPYFQTQRYERYKAVAKEWLETGKAYRCFCSPHRLNALRESQLKLKQKPRYDGHCRHQELPASSDSSFVVRFKTPSTGHVVVEDKVYGTIQINNEELDDLVIIRSDGHPTYNFAVVIDDADMHITHVIRGDDHLNNTPRQIHLFNALGAPIPTFAHLPMILGDDGKRLSKRHGSVDVLAYKQLGILPHALLNYLVRLGWSCKDQEIFTKKEMIEYFDLNKVSRSAAIFGYDKLIWLNQHYLKSEPPAALARYLEPYCNSLGLNLKNGPALEDLICLQRERCKTLNEIADKSRYFYKEEVNYDKSDVKKYLSQEVFLPLNSLLLLLKQISHWDANQIQNCINQVMVEYNLKMPKLAQPLRVAVTGAAMSPSIDKTLALIGKNRSIMRLRFALNHFFSQEGEV